MLLHDQDKGSVGIHTTVSIRSQVKQDLRMLALRGALDPKRFYRNPDATKFPKYFQMGTVVGGPTDFYTGETSAFTSKWSAAPDVLQAGTCVLVQPAGRWHDRH